MDEKILLEIISNYTSYDVESIKEDMNFADDLGIDSLDFLDILSTIEDQFKIEISEDESVGGIETVGQAIEFVKNRVEE